MAYLIADPAVIAKVSAYISDAQQKLQSNYTQFLGSVQGSAAYYQTDAANIMRQTVTGPVTDLHTNLNNTLNWLSEQVMIASGQYHGASNQDLAAQHKYSSGVNGLTTLSPGGAAYHSLLNT